MTGPEPTPTATRRPVERNLADRVVRRRDAAIAGHEGDGDAARAYLGDPDASVRATALGSLARAGVLTSADVAVAVADIEPAVRRRVAEVLASTEVDLTTSDTLLALLDDAEAVVVETAAWAAGEWLGREDAPAAATEDRILERLIWLTTEHEDALCREAAVAALGAIGDDRGLPAILRATTDKATVRRRAVIALAPFDEPEAEAALERARDDRDWQVRQAAEDLRGRAEGPDETDAS